MVIHLQCWEKHVVSEINRRISIRWKKMKKRETNPHLSLKMSFWHLKDFGSPVSLIFSLQQCRVQNDFTIVFPSVFFLQYSDVEREEGVCSNWIWSFPLILIVTDGGRGRTKRGRTGRGGRVFNIGSHFHYCYLVWRWERITILLREHKLKRKLLRGWWGDGHDESEWQDDDLTRLLRFLKY